MRRNVGYSSLQRHLDTTSSYSSLSESINTQQTEVLTAQLATFQQALATFSSRHRSKIVSNPEFRAYFSALCAQLGVDPLGGGQKGVWDKMGMGDWYHALGVQIVDVCLRARDRGGGMVALDEVIHAVNDLRAGPAAQTKGKRSTDVTESDVRRAIASLKPLESGYDIIKVGAKKVVRCTPAALDRDSLVAIDAADAQTGTVDLERVCAHTLATTGTRWTHERATRAIDSAVDEGLVWLDAQAPGATATYYVPALFAFA